MEYDRGRLLDDSLPYNSVPSRGGGILQTVVPSSTTHQLMSLTSGGGTNNYLLAATPSNSQQPLAIPVSASSSQQGLRKVLVKPLPARQGIPAVISGLIATPSNTAFGPLVDLSITPQQVGFPSIQPPNFSASSNLVQIQPLSPPPPVYLPGQSTSSVIETGTEQEVKMSAQPSIKSAKRRSSSQSSMSMSANRPRKPCNCKNSQCLKLYCDCFANGEFCRESCNCQNCKNSFQHEEDRSRAVKACLERNPNAFKPKVGHGRIGDERRHIKGCNCKKSSCLKNYCECYEAKIPCSHLCRCVGCQNLADRPEGKGLMQLANAADLRTQQQKAASSHFLEEMVAHHFLHTSHHEEGQRLPYSFVNKDVTKATTLCLLEEASHSASSGKSPVEVERAVLIEFGRCLEQIISSSESANEAHREAVSGKV